MPLGAGRSRGGGHSAFGGRAQATLSMPLSANTEITRSNARYVPSRAPCDTSREHPARAWLDFAVYVWITSVCESTTTYEYLCILIIGTRRGVSTIIVGSPWLEWCRYAPTW